MADQRFADIEQKLCAAADCKFRVFGVRRTGQHAIINWILRNAGRADTVFLNSCTLRRSVVRSCGRSELNGSQSGNIHGLATALSGFLNPQTRPFVLFSYETGYRQGNITPHFASETFDHQVLVTRSFVNWLPSFMRLMQAKLQPSGDEMLDVSRRIIIEMARYKAHLRAAQTSAHTVICFDKWATLPAYRLSKLVALGLTPVDNTMGKVQIYGRGSSFSGRKLPPEELALTARWQTMAGDPYARLFLQLALEDEDFVDVLMASFPEDPGIIRQLLATSA